MVLYRRLWQLLFESLEKTLKVQTTIGDIIENTEMTKINHMNMLAAMRSLDHEAVNFIKTQIETTIRFYSSAQEIDKLINSVYRKLPDYLEERLKARSM